MERGKELDGFQALFLHAGGKREGNTLKSEKWEQESRKKLHRKVIQGFPSMN